MTMQETVAANVRARLAWSRVSHEQAAKKIGRSVRSLRARLAGDYPFRPDELAALADLFGMGDPGAFFRVPEGFATVVSESAWTRRTAGHSLLRHLPRAA